MSAEKLVYTQEICIVIPMILISLFLVCRNWKHYVFVNAYQTVTINFSIPQAVKLLNKALLLHFYNIKGWDISLIPIFVHPSLGRADYVHYIAGFIK